MKITINILFLSILFHSSAQNLVPNPSFEDTTQCPNSTAQLSYTNDWIVCGSSTDFYHECSPSGNMSVPSNIYGFQAAADGKAYIGCIMYAVGDPLDPQGLQYREPVGAYLNQPMIIGTTYYVSFKVSPTLNDFESGEACDKLGAKFSTISYSESNPTPIDNFAHIYTDSTISDTSIWTIVSGSFIADSNYTFINIGNFFDSIQSTYTHIDGPWYTYSAYYFIDDVCVSTDSSTCFGYVGIKELIHENKKLKQIVDTLGRETEDKPNTLMIYIYNDGTTEKVFRVE